MSEVGIRLSAKALEEAASIAQVLRHEAGPAVEKRFAQELSRTLDLLRLNTKLGRKTARARVYVLLLSRFPYHLIYKRVGPSELSVLRIRHAHRRPLTWL